MNGAGDGRPVVVEAGTLAGRHFRYFDFMMAAFVTILLLSNIIGAGKRAVSICRGSAPRYSAQAFSSFLSRTCSATY